MILVLVVLLAGLWWLLQDNRPGPVPRNEVALVPDTAPRAPAPARGPHAPPDTHDAAPPPPPGPPPQAAPAADEPELHRPDYGHAIWRGGARIEFELADAAGNPVPAQFCRATLWRQLGSWWLRDECEVQGGTSLVVCHGLGEPGIPPAGLEPGEYELDIQSARYGALRHRFSVRAGEQRRERLLLPNWTRTICLRFAHPDGSPLLWIKTPPVVSVSSPDLPEVERPGAPPVNFRTAPTDEPANEGMGGGWFSSRSSSSRRPSRDNQVYPTDQGRYWVRVWVGADNTIRFPLGELWGTQEFTLSGRFTESHWDDYPVTLNTAGDFAQRVETMDKRQADPPGGRQVIAADEYAEFTRPAEAWDPLTAPMRPDQARLVVRVTANFEPQVQFSYDGVKTNGAFSRHGELFSAYFVPDKPAYFRISDGGWFATAWERIPELSPGRVTEARRDATALIVRVTCDGLSPTLKAFAHTVDLDIGMLKAPAGRDVEDPRITEDSSDNGSDEDRSSDKPTMELAERPDPRYQTPPGGSVLHKLVLRQRDRETSGELRLGPASLPAPAAGEQLTSRAHLRGVALFNRPWRGSYELSLDGRDVFTPLTFDGTWRAHDGDPAVLLAGGSVQPRVDRAFCLRAVGQLDEGLPWVCGTIMEYRHDETARAVRAMLADRDHELSPPDRKAYARELAEVEAAPTEAGLRALIGDAWDRLDTDTQRLWFARHGTWYGRTRLCSDEQGYVVTGSLKLEPGRVYVLYLWSNSRNELHPDARVVFKAAEGVTDLGAIRMPSYR